MIKVIGHICMDLPYELMRERIWRIVNLSTKQHLSDILSITQHDLSVPALLNQPS